LSLGRIGVVGVLGRRTTGNFAFVSPNTGAIGVSGGAHFGKITGGNDFGTDARRYNDVMPYSGKFTELRTFDEQGLVRCIQTLQKNNVNTVLTTDNDPPARVIRKIVADVPFVAGDLFRFRYDVLTIGSPRRWFHILFGGFDVP